MKAETDKLIVKVMRADKLELERIAQAEGESVSVVVRRILKAALRTLAVTDQERLDQAKGELCQSQT